MFLTVELERIYMQVLQEQIFTHYELNQRKANNNLIFKGITNQLHIKKNLLNYSNEANQILTLIAHYPCSSLFSLVDYTTFQSILDFGCY